MHETDPLLPRPPAWSADPGQVFALAGLLDRPAADYPQAPAIVLIRRRRVRLEVCRRQVDLPPAELAGSAPARAPGPLVARHRRGLADGARQLTGRALHDEIARLTSRSR